MQVECLPYSQFDKEIVAATIIAEAGGEHLRGMQAVMNVIFNRAKGNAALARQVCLTPYIFTPWNGKDIASVTRQAKEHPCWQQALMIAEQGLKGNLPDITGGANHFYNHRLVHPFWAKKMRRTTVIEGHTFLVGAN